MQLKAITSIFWANAWRQFLYTFLIVLVSGNLMKACLYLVPASLGDPIFESLESMPLSTTRTLFYALCLFLLGLWYCLPLFWSLKKALTIPYKDFQIVVHERFSIFNKAFRRFFAIYAIGVPILSYFIAFKLNLSIENESFFALLAHMILLVSINILSLDLLFKFPTLFGFQITKGNKNPFSVAI